MANKKAKKALPKTAPQTKPIAQGKIVKPAIGTPVEKSSLRLKLALLLGILSFLVYANTIRNGFVLDDSNTITENKIVTKGISAIPEILSTPYRRGFYITTNDSYRPLSLVMFAVEYQLFGSNPAPGHFINILFYIGCVILLFLFFDQLFEQKNIAVAFIASLLFALHPIHTEVVANIKSRDELLCFFFAFLCLNVFIRYVRSGKIAYLLLGAFCFLLSLLAKETVISFLAVIVLVFFFYKNENKKRSIYLSVGALLAAGIYLFARYSVLSYYNANGFSNINFIDNALAKADISYVSRFATAILIMGYYIKLLFVPYPLICDYSYNTIPFVSFSDPWAMISLLAYVLLAVLGIWRFLKNRKDAIAFGILFFFIAMALYSNILFLIAATLGERFLFFGSAGFCLVVAVLMEKLLRKPLEKDLTFLKNPKLLGIIIPISLIYVLIAVNRNGDWHDPYTLCTTDIKKAPNDSRLNYFVGYEMQNKANDEKDLAKQKQFRAESISYLTKAVTIYPEFRDAHSKLGEVYSTNGQFDSAEIHEEIALRLSPGDPLALFTLSSVYIALRKYSLAIGILQKMIDSKPDDEKAHMNIAYAFYCAGQYDSSVAHDERVLQLNPKNTEAINNLAGVYFANKKYPQAISMYHQIIEMKPNFVDPYTNIGTCYFYLNRYDSSVYFLNEAISVNPGFNSSYENLAYTYNAMKKLDSAKKYETIAQKNNPGFKL